MRETASGATRQPVLGRWRSGDIPTDAPQKIATAPTKTLVVSNAAYDVEKRTESQEVDEQGDDRRFDIL